MDRRELDNLFEEVWASYGDVMDAARGLTNTQLEARVPFYGGREVTLRNLLYMLVTHPREHTTHLVKILQETGAPGASPTEAQLVLGEIAESIGHLRGLLARMTDADLDRGSEGHTVRTVLEHVASTHRSYAQRLQAAQSGAAARAVS